MVIAQAPTARVQQKPPEDGQEATWSKARAGSLMPHSVARIWEVEEALRKLIHVWR